MKKLQKKPYFWGQVDYLSLFSHEEQIWNRLFQCCYFILRPFIVYYSSKGKFKKLNYVDIVRMEVIIVENYSIVSENEIFSYRNKGFMSYDW